MDFGINGEICSSIKTVCHEIRFAIINEMAVIWVSNAAIIVPWFMTSATIYSDDKAKSESDQWLQQYPNE